MGKRTKTGKNKRFGSNCFHVANDKSLAAHPWIAILRAQIFFKKASREHADGERREPVPTLRPLPHDASSPRPSNAWRPSAGPSKFGRRHDSGKKKIRGSFGALLPPDPRRRLEAEALASAQACYTPLACMADIFFYLAWQISFFILHGR